MHLREQKARKHPFPDHVINVDGLPVTPAGRVRKAALREDAARGAEPARWW
jgi:non-ribosomal peptide synthetase component E (peptide arylation enzyme)